MSQAYTGLEPTKPTSIWCCTPGDVIVLSITLLIIVLLAIAGIAIGIASAAIGSKCSSIPLPNGDIISNRYNTTGISFISFTGDVTTSFQVNTDSSEKDILVNVTRQSLLSNTYTNVNSQMSVTNGTKAFITTNVPTTDFTDCIYVKRTIILPQAALQNVNIQINIWKSDVTFEDTGLFLNIANLTFVGGANNLKLNKVKAQSLIVSVTSGSISFTDATAFFSLVSISMDGAFTIKNSTILIGQFSTRDGTITASNVTNSYSPNPFVKVPGNITTASRYGPQYFSRIQGSNVITLTSSYGYIELRNNAADFAGTYRAESRKGNTVSAQGVGVDPSGAATGTIKGTIGSGNSTLSISTEWTINIYVN